MLCQKLKISEKLRKIGQPQKILQRTQDSHNITTQPDPTQPKHPHPPRFLSHPFGLFFTTRKLSSLTLFFHPFPFCRLSPLISSAPLSSHELHSTGRTVQPQRLHNLFLQWRRRLNLSLFLFRQSMHYSSFSNTQHTYTNVHTHSVLYTFSLSMNTFVADCPPHYLFSLHFFVLFLFYTSMFSLALPHNKPTSSTSSVLFD